MRYHNITCDDMLNGDGLRTVLWLAGCEHHCKDCQNPVTWDPDGGLPFDEKAKQELFDNMSLDYISGVTFSGGDPLFVGNRDEVLALCKEIREKFPDKTIWMYTGYTYEEIKKLSILDYIDVLVDGRFEVDKLDVQAKWRGSINQRVIDVQQTLMLGKVVLFCD